MASMTGTIGIGNTSGYGEAFLHPSGLSFRRPDVANFASLSGKQCFGKLLDNPEFTDMGSFEAKIAAMEDVEAMPAFIKREGPSSLPELSQDTFEEVANKKWIVGTKTGNVYSIMSGAYKIVQDSEILEPLKPVLESYGFRPIGRFSNHNGRTAGSILMADPSLVINLLDDYVDPVMIGFRPHNSHTGETCFGADIIGIKTVCLNFNNWGDVKYTMSYDHTRTFDKVAADYTKLIEASLNMTTTIQNRMHIARSNVITTAELEPLLFGIDLPPSAIEDIAGNVAHFAPAVSELGLNAFTLYDATTAWVTWRPGSNINQPATMIHAKNAAKLLNANLDALLNEGVKKRDLYLESERLKEQMKASPMMVGANGRRV